MKRLKFNYILVRISQYSSSNRLEDITISLGYSAVIVIIITTIIVVDVAIIIIIMSRNRLGLFESVSTINKLCQTR